MKNSSGGSYLFEHYRKKSDLFISFLYKANITLNEDDIHNVRVEVKKLRSFFRLLVTLHKNSAELKTLKDFNSVFKNIFSFTGQLREAQLNVSEVSKHNLNRAELNSYKKFLKDKEKKSVSEFRSEMKSFDIDRFIEIKKEVEIICNNMININVYRKYTAFINKEIRKIKKILKIPQSSVNLHRMRKYFKNIHAAAVHLNKIKGNPEVNRIMKKVKKSEVMLGDWHDKVVFCTSLRNFLKKNETASLNKFPQIADIYNTLELNNEVRIIELYKKIKNILKNIKI